MTLVSDLLVQAQSVKSSAQVKTQHVARNSHMLLPGAIIPTASAIDRKIFALLYVSEREKCTTGE